MLAKLGEVDAHIAAVDRRIDEQNPVDLTATVAEMREFVLRNILELRTLLREDPVRSKAALARHIGPLKLIPRETDKGPVYEVNGALELLNANDVMPLVARDGIEPPNRLWRALRLATEGDENGLRR